MADRCFGCTNKFKFREKPRVCPQCHRNFCSKCLDPKRKDRTTCVYCAQKAVYRNEETKIVQNFQEHFNKHKRHHQTPPIVSRLQFDTSRAQKQPDAHPTDPQTPYVSGKLAPEDEELVKRLQRLRESHTPETEAASEEEMKERLGKLRGESSEGKPPDGGGGEMNPAAGTGTDVEKAEDLMEQMKGEVELDERLAETQKKEEEELFSRYSALRGEKYKPVQPSSEGTTDGDMDKVTSSGGGEEDPEELLHDLKEMQAKEEKGVLLELGSSGLHALVESAATGKVPDISYPSLPEDTHHEDEEEIARVMKKAKEEGHLEEERRKEDDKFIGDASKQLAKLRGEEEVEKDEEEEEEVRSKPAGAAGKSSGLAFTWAHFGGSDTVAASAGEPSVARSMGMVSDWMEEEDDSDFDQQVEELLEQMTSEGMLDERLEREGLKHLVGNEDKERKSPPPPEISAYPPPSPPSATSALPPPPPPPAAATAYGYGDFGRDQLPWCCICNQDATIRCFDCDSDLYCMQCFSEGHEQFGLFDHHYAPFEPPRQTV